MLENIDMIQDQIFRIAMVEEIMIMIILRLFSDIVAPLDIIQHQMK
jgi:hypothetical protein